MHQRAMAQRHRVSESDDFYSIAMQSLLDLCGHSVNNQPITELAGCLVLTVSSGDIYELSINQTSVDDFTGFSTLCSLTDTSKLNEVGTLPDTEPAGGKSLVVEPDVSIDNTKRCCVNCGCTETGRWRLVNKETMCNACGLYFNLNGTNRPLHLQSRLKCNRKRNIRSTTTHQLLNELSSPPSLGALMGKDISMRQLVCSVKQFQCEQCDSKFKTPSSLHQHETLAHGTVCVSKTADDKVRSAQEISSPKKLSIDEDIIVRDKELGSDAACAGANASRCKPDKTVEAMVVEDANRLYPVSISNNIVVVMPGSENSLHDAFLRKNCEGLNLGMSRPHSLPKKMIAKDKVAETDADDKRRRRRRNECPSCSGSYFNSGLDKRRHVRDFHKLYKCRLCLVEFVGQLALFEHVKLEHPGEPSYKMKLGVLVCEYCTKAYFNSSHLRDHIATHHFGIRFQCHYCSKQLASAYTRTVHEREKHQTKHMLTCEGCGQQFTRLASLIFHLRSTHPQLVPERYRQRFQQLHCEPCGLYFSRRSSLRRHLEVRHGNGEKKYKCVMCDKSFPCRRYVLRHQRTHHPTPSEPSEQGGQRL